jgi:predicted metal-dependent enzyme (double-stranded beta helix superfamily)
MSEGERKHEKNQDTTKAPKCVTLGPDCAIFSSFIGNQSRRSLALHVLPLIFSCERRKSLSFYDILSLS